MKKTKLKNKEKYEIKFWKDWLEADTIKRYKLVENLPLFKMCLQMKNSDVWKSSVSTLINGYFEDLESAIYTKTRLDKKNDL